MKSHHWRYSLPIYYLLRTKHNQTNSVQVHRREVAASLTFWTRGKRLPSNVQPRSRSNKQRQKSSGSLFYTSWWTTSNCTFTTVPKTIGFQGIWRTKTHSEALMVACFLRWKLIIPRWVFLRRCLMEHSLWSNYGSSYLHHTNAGHVMRTEPIQGFMQARWVLYQVIYDYISIPQVVAHIFYGGLRKWAYRYN